MITVAALYQFKKFPDFAEEAQSLKKLGLQLDIKGSLLLGEEGINGTISGIAENIYTLKNYLVEHLGFDNLEYKESTALVHPFYRLKIKLKKEIVTLGIKDLDPSKDKGQYLDPIDWNALLRNKNTIVIDTRNDYEYKIGTFKGAINPETKKFTDFPAFVEKNKENWKDKNIAMFCTGGIRCEKSTAFLKYLKFDQVFHLKGGILKYLEIIPEAESLWEGFCYVFDHRVAVGHGLALTDYKNCGGCRMPLSPEDRQISTFEEGVHCLHCVELRTTDQLKAARDRQLQIKLANERGYKHMGADQRRSTSL
jgi:UPF0176 protein